MKTSLLTLAALFTTLAAHAGIVLVQDLKQTGPMPLDTQMTIKVEGEKIRVDVGKEITSIMDSSTGEVSSLMHAQKIAMQMPKGALDAVKKQAAAHNTEAPNIEPTGKEEKINGFDCKEYAGTYEGLKVSYWVTQDVKNAEAIMDQLGQLSGEADPFKGLMKSGEGFPGFPVRTVVESPQTGKMTMTIVSVKEEPVPATDFQVPSDYKTMAIPQMQGQSGGAPAIPTTPGSN